MFGDLIQQPSPKKDKDGNLKRPAILPFVWTYLFKDGTTPKARGTRYGGNGMVAPSLWLTHMPAV